jgi:hypothetical protein
MWFCTIYAIGAPPLIQTLNRNVNTMLLNEFLKEHQKVEEQEATITQLKKEMETVVAHLKEHDSKIQKVSDRPELNKPAPQMVSSGQ